MPEQLLRTDQIAEILDVPVDRVASMAREGLLPAIRCGRSWRFSPSKLKDWMESGGAGGWRRSSQSHPLQQHEKPGIPDSTTAVAGDLE